MLMYFLLFNVNGEANKLVAKDWGRVLRYSSLEINARVYFIGKLLDTTQICIDNLKCTSRIETL